MCSFCTSERLFAMIPFIICYVHSSCGQGAGFEALSLGFKTGDYPLKESLTVARRLRDSWV